MTNQTAVRTCYLCDKQSQTDTDGSDKGVLALLRRQHEHGEDQFTRQEHLKEDALSYGHAGSKGSLGGGNVSGYYARNHCGGNYTAEYLSREQNESCCVCQQGKPCNGIALRTDL